MKFISACRTTLLSVAILGMSVLSMNVLAQEFNFPHISTSGYGEVKASPDMAEFSVRIIVTSANTAEEAKKKTDQVVESFISRLKKSGIDPRQISSSNLNLSPQYSDYNETKISGEPKLVGYQASRRVTVEVSDLAKLNQYLDVALGEGINQIDNIQLKVKDNDKYQQQARLAAIKDANAKAKSLADGFKLKLGGVWKINYNASYAQPVLMRSMATNAKMASDSYQDSEITIRDQVEVIYQLEK